MRLSSSSMLGRPAVLWLGALFVLAAASCQKPPAPPALLKPPINKHCKIQLRRDYLGLTAGTGASIDVDRANGIELSVRGRIISADERWVVVRPREAKSKDDDIWDIWVPREAILLIYATPTDLSPPPSPRP